MAFGRIRRVLGLDRIMLRGIPLPPTGMRPGGRWFAHDDDYLRSAQREVDRLRTVFDLDSSTRLIEIGCGPGRLAIGLAEHFGWNSLPHYVGVDVRPDFVRWCTRRLARRSDRLRFVLIDMQNDRYNPNGETTEELGQLPFAAGEFDLAYLYSVFSHLRTEDVVFYLQELHRILLDDGQVFLTAFLSEEGPEVAENPDDIPSLPAQGPLHVVRYRIDYLQGLCTAANLAVDILDKDSETDGQWALRLRKTPQPR